MEEAGSFPRYFVAAGEPTAVSRPRAALAAQVLDVFRWRRAGTVSEVVVVRDLRGELAVVEGAGELPTSLRAALNRHELAAGGLRTVTADGLWLLDVEAMEQMPDTPGTNDPIYLRGRLSGPWGGAVFAATGRLALTRADLLAGLVEGEPFAMRAGSAEAGARCLHAAIPAGRAEEVALGQAYVLAYALVPYELQPDDAANEAVVAQIVHDVLGALKADLRAAKVAHWLAKEPLPVPSRPALEAHLAGQGWKIKGNVATLPSGPRPGISGFLSMALGIDYDRKIALPREAPPAAFLILAQRMVSSFPDFPDERAVALSRRVDRPGASPRVVVASGSPAVGLTEAIRLPARPQGERDEWEAHFRRAVASPGLGTLVTPVR